MFETPIFIVTRDRVTDLARLVAWLEDAGYQRITILDNQSTYEPLRDYLARSPHDVVDTGHNWGSRVLWVADTLTGPPGEWFVLTDPDVLPIEECPPDVVHRLHELLCRYPQFPKAGPGLYLADVPADLPSLEWERELINPARQLEPHAFDSLIDTTFSLYRPHAEFTFAAIRTTGPYQCRHLPWYRKPPLPPDDAYYLAHVNRDLGPEGTTWEAK